MVVVSTRWLLRNLETNGIPYLYVLKWLCLQSRNSATVTPVSFNPFLYLRVDYNFMQLYVLASLNECMYLTRWGCGAGQKSPTNSAMTPTPAISCPRRNTLAITVTLSRIRLSKAGTTSRWSLLATLESGSAISIHSLYTVPQFATRSIRFL